MMENDKELENLFNEARHHKSLVSESLLARVVDDAVRETAMREEDIKRATRERPSMGAIWRFIGGWVTAVSFATCTAAGVYVGYLAPDVLGYGFDAAGNVTELFLQDFDLVMEGL